MALNDDIKTYEEKFGDIPLTKEEQLQYVIDKKKIKPKEFIKLRENIALLSLSKWESFNFVIHLVPKASPRPRYSSRTRRFYVFDAADNSRLFKEFLESLLDERPDVIVTPCKIWIDTYAPTPNDMNRIESILAELGWIQPVSTPDFDNLTKTYCDMIQKHLLLNDSLIVQGQTRKFYSCKPRIEVRLQYRREFDSKYTKKKVENWTYYKDMKNKPDLESLLK